jgi:hypothetical protein
VERPGGEVEVDMLDHGLIKHKEIEGDQINAIIVHPESKN